MVGPRPPPRLVATQPIRVQPPLSSWFNAHSPQPDLIADVFISASCAIQRGVDENADVCHAWYTKYARDINHSVPYPNDCYDHLPPPSSRQCYGLIHIFNQINNVFAQIWRHFFFVDYHIGPKITIKLQYNYSAHPCTDMAYLSR